VVLGCRVGPGGDLRGAVLRRVSRAHEAWLAASPPLVIPSGGRRWSDTPEAAAMRLALLARGVPHDALAPELRSMNTRENARFSVALLRERGARRVGVVTCDWHMPRALALFARHAAPDVPGGEALSFFALPAPSPPTTLRLRLYRRGRERVARWLDAMDP
jgi:uncharacterized SAM-binding protein YcdF (DUF218 family)